MDCASDGVVGAVEEAEKMEAKNEAAKNDGGFPVGEGQECAPPSITFSEEDDSDFDYIRVFENVGTKIYAYFLPDEIFRMSQANGRIRRHVAQHLIGLFKQNVHLPLTVDLGPRPLAALALGEDAGCRLRRRWSGLRPRTRAMFASGDAFLAREKWVDHVVRTLLAGSDLRQFGAAARSEGREDPRESLDRARERLGAGDDVKLGLADRGGSVRLQPNANGLQADRRRRNESARVLGLSAPPLGEGLLACRHAAMDRRDARDAVDRYFGGGRGYQGPKPGGYKSFAKSWLQYILSQHDTLVTRVRYVFIHPNEIESIITEGLIISHSSVGDSITVRFKTQV